MDIKISILFKTFIFLTFILTIIGLTTQNFSTKACMYFSVAITLAFTFELDFIYERYEKAKFKIKRKIKEVLIWTIFCEASFIIWLSTFQVVSELLTDFSISEEYLAAITFVAWIFTYQVIKLSSATIIKFSIMTLYKSKKRHHGSVSCCCNKH